MGEPYRERMAIDSDSLGIGAEIRRLRRWRGMTLEALAGQAGISKGYLSKIENGHAALDRRSTLAAIARGLRVSLADLGAEHVLADHEDHDADAAIPAIRFALLATSLDDADHRAGRSADELAIETDRLATARQACRYSEVGRALPALLTDLHATAALAHGAERDTALRSLVQAAQVTTLLVKNMGAVDLAWVAAERGHQAATRLADPLWVAASEFARTQALIGLGAYSRAEALARKALTLLRTDSESALEVYGTSILTAGFCASVTGSDNPTAAIMEAEEIARRTEGINAFFLAFSPTNVDLWRISIALECDDPVHAADVANGVNIDKIPMKSRKAAFLIDHARALHALRGRDTDVVHLLRQADRLGPTRTRHNIWVREIVAELVQRARRDAGGRELRGLADRMGLLGAI
jgi:transcriptional regulator with XRE-family HTH domain